MLQSVTSSNSRCTKQAPRWVLVAYRTTYTTSPSMVATVPLTSPICKVQLANLCPRKNQRFRACFWASMARTTSISVHRVTCRLILSGQRWWISLVLNTNRCPIATSIKCTVSSSMVVCQFSTNLRHPTIWCRRVGRSLLIHPVAKASFRIRLCHRSLPRWWTWVCVNPKTLAVPATSNSSSSSLLYSVTKRESLMQTRASSNSTKLCMKVKLQ